MYWKLGMVVLTLGMGFTAGWSTNGWRLEARIASLKASHAEDIATHIQATREAEKRLIEASERIRRDRDGRIKNLNSQLSSALSELQQRQTRKDNGPNDSTTCSGATGANLSKEDAEFLAREAARADAVVENLNYCITQYNSIRNSR